MNWTKRSAGVGLPVLIAVFAFGMTLSATCGDSAAAEKEAMSVAVPKVVRQLIAGRRSGEPVAPPTVKHGSFSLDRAYEIQAALKRRLARLLGPVVGYKVAYASKAAQEQFGISAPASGPFFLIQHVPNGSTIPAGEFNEVIFETEVAFTIGERISEPIDDLKTLKKHVRSVHAAFDIGNNRYDASAGKPTVADQVANGVGAHRFIIGPAMDPAEIDVDSLTLRLAVGDETVAESPATEVLGSPWNSLQWLANQVTARGETLEPGYVILTGTAAPAYRAKGESMKAKYTGDCGPLGVVQCEIK